MAIMIPSVISPEIKSNAEKKIFEWFRSSHGTDKWIVLHSLGIATHHKVIYGETDFLVLAPQLGIFALEVKGGRIRRENGIWYFTNRYGTTNCNSRGPFEQAKDGIYSIMDAIKKRIDHEHRNIPNVLFGYGVMFPDIEYTTSGIDEEQWQVFDARDGCDVKQFIKRLADNTKVAWESHYGPASSFKFPDAAAVRYIASILRGDFDHAVSIGVQIRDTQEALIALTHEQYRCLDQLEDNCRCLIRGPAGTGKTLLAIEAVKRFAAQGKKVALFCYNSNLAEWLEYYFNKVPKALRPHYVGTFHKYMTGAAQGSALLPSYPVTHENIQKYFSEVLPEAAALALLENEEPYDVILVDEAQDLIQDNYLEVMNACLKQGLSRGRWTMFGDFSMQAIYTDGVSGQELVERLEKYASFIRFKLTINCRNTRQICNEIEVVTGVKAPLELWSNVDGAPVQYITWSTMAEQCKELKALLGRLKPHVSPEKVTILSPRKREDSVISLLDGYMVKNFSLKDDKNITFSTIQAFKGLENTVIILTDIEDFSSEKLMYIGLSRACSMLFVLESDTAKKAYDNLWVRRVLK